MEGGFDRSKSKLADFLLQELLSQHWDKQAVVFLKDVKFDQLQALVDYMYRGEVNVSQDQLAAFLNTAEALKIKGLADSDRDRKSEKRILEKANRSLSPSTGTSRQPKQARKASKDDSPPVVAAEKPQLPLLPSLVRIPHITSHEDSNDGGEESPESLNNDNDCHSNENDATENLNVELEDGEHFSMVEPKIEAEQEEVEYSGASGDEEDWSDSEYPSQIDASQGKFPTSASGTYSANDIFSITEWTKQGGKHGTTIYLQIKTDISSPDTLISTVAMQIIQLEVRPAMAIHNSFLWAYYKPFPTQSCLSFGVWSNALRMVASRGRARSLICLGHRAIDIMALPLNYIPMVFSRSSLRQASLIFVLTLFGVTVSCVALVFGCNSFKILDKWWPSSWYFTRPSLLVVCCFFNGTGSYSMD